jgi:hypothetical protein
MILNTIMTVAKGINWYLALWRWWPKLCEGCLVTVVSITKIVCEWYLATVVTMHMMLIRKIKRVRYEWKNQMTLINYSGSRIVNDINRSHWYRQPFLVWLATPGKEANDVKGSWHRQVLINKIWLTIIRKE